MQERVTAQSEDFVDIVVQFHPDHGSLGIGLEPHGGQHHFVDSIYGGENQVRIAKIFCDKMDVLNLEHAAPVFANEEAEERWLNELGRSILDSVTGSTPAEGVWTWLTRAGSNRLIRLVRKGRDTTFGRDE